ncbi:STE24 endopeptidase [Desulfocicer vacuolatum DSM 3385]|uniref:STE24 endopeptidase n=1 Tax=Desulfocicer vacuolatum DSM 3385 TaxID=1121400 RepID=A0A1W2EH89_9BACT|nr:M48 family metallopeptidase [Desulfocicer vacuolatum]SMD08995.1 STE24 endopeptidase [Desulfocicer vacuolatum DSM 3385]
METTIFYIIIGILVLNYALERLLDHLNISCMGQPIPKALEGVYDPEKYNKQQLYQKTNTQFELISSTFSLMVVLVFLFITGFARVHVFAAGITGNPIMQSLIFFGILMLAQDIMGTPFQIYKTFVIEEKFGFNKVTWKLFIGDKIKGWLLTTLLGGGILALITWFYHRTTDMFWIYAWLMVGGVSLFFTMFYSNLIVPLFNKQTKLEHGELKTAIEEFAVKVNFPVKDIYILDGSKRSTKANAYFTGLGSKKRIVLFDTLIKDLTTEEVVAVLAHEIGHYKKKHTLQGIVISIVQMGVLFYLLSLFLGQGVFSRALGADRAVFHMGLVAFAMLYSPVSLATELIMNVWSRKNEYQADDFAVQHFNGSALGNALKKLSINNLSNLTPHPAYVFFYYSHPSLHQRIVAMNNKG